MGVGGPDTKTGLLIAGLWFAIGLSAFASLSAIGYAAYKLKPYVEHVYVAAKDLYAQR